MVQILSKSLTLEEFLKLPETKPPREYIDKQIRQKPMPKARHSRLRSKIVAIINQIAEAENIAYAFPELRCTFGGRSIVPDIAILQWKNILLDEKEEPVDDVFVAPDWTIEILSPGQSANQVTANILHCLQHGCQLGWLIDPEDSSTLVFQPQRQPEICYQKDKLKVLAELQLDLAVEELFNLLKMKTK